jgi:hypothetical protein
VSLQCNVGSGYAQRRHSIGLLQQRVFEFILQTSENAPCKGAEWRNYSSCLRLRSYLAPLALEVRFQILPHLGELNV